MQIAGFIGKATVAIDGKGRTNFPREFRKMLRPEAEGVVVVTIAEEKTLALYPAYEWNKYVGYLESLGRAPQVTKFRMRITSMARSSVLDAQNRIGLSPELLSYAGLEGEVTFAADGNRVRLWQPERFAETYEKLTPEEESSLEEMFYLDVK